ncbi:MAG: IMP dehydrogenase [Defluviitaleaceae bacterium]|nr:IMP dehydrogenase [Defluviitaleaceae bacterium]
MATFKKKGYSFDDVLLVPRESKVLPSMVSLKTNLTNNIILNIPLISAAMDTVTEYKMAVAMSLYGGVGVIHKNMPIETQAEQVKLVKNKKIDFDEYPNAVTDKNDKLLVCAGIGVSKDMEERAAALIDAKVDVLVIDSAHGHSENVINAVKKIKSKYTVDVIAGNVATEKGTLALIDAGVDCVKVGIGPGSICTTRIISGVGVPQITAISDAAEAANRYNIPIIGDGGIKYSGDITKAIAAGSSVCMLGSLLAGHSECPAELVSQNGIKYMAYRGMGSLGAMYKGSGDRYSQEGATKFVPEGVEALTPFKGPVHDTLYQLLGGLRSGMGYCGFDTIGQLRTESEFIIITSAGMVESKPHSVTSIEHKH